jgi:hypothetical protein
MEVVGCKDGRIQVLHQYLGQRRLAAAARPVDCDHEWAIRPWCSSLGKPNRESASDALNSTSSKLSIG